MRKIIAVFMLFFGLLSIAEPVLACNPPPPPQPTYIDCSDLGRGYKFGFRIDGAPNGVFPLSSRVGTLIGGAPSDSKNYIKISNSDYRVFDWSASLGIDAVIIQAGGKPTVRKLSEDKNGNDFHGLADNRGKAYRVEKVTFCYDYELGVSVEAQGSGSNTTAWAITKQVDTSEQNKFAGEKAIFNYTVTVDKTAGELTGLAVASTVKIKNNTPLSARIASIGEVLNPGSTATKLNCGRIRFPYSLGARGELTCTSSTPVQTRPENSRVVVNTSNDVGGGKASTQISWSESATAYPAPGTDSITVTDSNAAFGGPYPVTAGQSWNYPVEIACPADPASYTDGEQTITLDNTAAITETGQKASQSVTLNCYAPTLSSATRVSYDVAYAWAITKTSPTKELTVQVGETASVDYTVGVSVAKQELSNFKASARVTVTNPNPSAPLAATLVDEIAPGVPAAPIDCATSITVPAGGSITCNFAGAVDSGQAAANTSKLTMNDIDFTASAPYDFQNAAKNEIDECVTVTDDALDNPLGTACADKAPASYTYSLNIGPYAQCRKNSTSYVNSAVYVANDTGASGYANWEVIITIPCPPDTNCTRTIDYWRTHGSPADQVNYAKTWDKVPPSGPASPFFTTNLTWSQMIQASPANQTYVQLAQAYIAARLNILYGAAARADVSAAISHAEQILARYAATQGYITGSVAQDFTSTAAALENFNNGRSGPPVCYDCNE